MQLVALGLPLALGVVMGGLVELVEPVEPPEAGSPKLVRVPEVAELLPLVAPEPVGPVVRCVVAEDFTVVVVELVEAVFLPESAATTLTMTNIRPNRAAAPITVPNTTRLRRMKITLLSRGCIEVLTSDYMTSYQLTKNREALIAICLKANWYKLHTFQVMGNLTTIFIICQ